MGDCAVFGGDRLRGHMATEPGKKHGTLDAADDDGVVFVLLV